MRKGKLQFIAPHVKSIQSVDWNDFPKVSLDNTPYPSQEKFAKFTETKLVPIVNRQNFMFDESLSEHMRGNPSFNMAKHLSEELVYSIKKNAERYLNRGIDIYMSETLGDLRFLAENKFESEISDSSRIHPIHRRQPHEFSYVFLISEEKQYDAQFLDGFTKKNIDSVYHLALKKVYADIDKMYSEERSERLFRNNRSNYIDKL